MTIHSNFIREDVGGYVFSLSDAERESPCFYCSQPVGDPAVQWMGATATIFLHPECVGQLMLRIERDVAAIHRDYDRQRWERRLQMSRPPGSRL